MEFEWDENKRIYWKELIDMLKQGLDIKGYEIDFRNEKIEFKDVSLLNRNGIRVPQELIYYNEDNIDFSDDPEVTDDEIKAIYITEALMVEPEIIAWIKKEKIDINKLAAQLIRNFYETVKNIPKNAAI